MRGAEVTQLQEGATARREEITGKLQDLLKAIASLDKDAVDRDAVSNDLKIVVETAREGYEAIKEHLKAQYEATSQQV